MLASSRKTAKAKLSSKLSGLDKLPSLPSSSLPDEFTLSQLYELVEPEDETPSTSIELENLLILHSALSNSDKLVRERGDNESIKSLLLWISKTILPGAKLNTEDEMPDASRQKLLTSTHLKATLGLQSLELLIDQLSSPRPKSLGPQILLSLIAFSSFQDTWTTPTIHSLSKRLLSLYTTQIQTQDFIITSILNTFIRPLFSPSKPSTVTSSGRAAMPSSAPLAPYDVAAERARKPWKYTTVYAVRVLSWVILNSPDEIVSQHWHLFTPPLLTLLDDPSTPHRISGSTLLSSFLPRLTPKLLLQSGLGPVFEDALLPTLLFLPELTPVPEALLLSGAAYGALDVLCDVRFGESGKERIAFLDRLMRQGVLTAYSHAHEHPAIAALLYAQIQTIVSKLGIHATKHLRALLPAILAPLLDPFAKAEPEMLVPAIKALQTVMGACWVRIGEQEGYRMEVLRGLVGCWRDVGSEERLGDVRTELKVAGRVFVRAVEGVVDVGEMLGPLVEVDKGVGELFGLDDEDEGESEEADEE